MRNQTSKKDIHPDLMIHQTDSTINSQELADTLDTGDVYTHEFRHHSSSFNMKRSNVIVMIMMEDSCSGHQQRTLLKSKLKEVYGVCILKYV